MRRLAAGLVLALAAAVLPASPAAAGVAVGTVTAVTSDVNERTPLYHLELVFTVSGVQCPAVVDYEMGGDTRSAPVDQCFGDPDGFFPLATATTMRPMFGEGLGTINPGGTDCDSGGPDDGPGCQIDVFVRHQDAPVLTTDLRPLLDGGSPVEVPIPPRPVWVGVGDGYTSRTTQMADWCFEASADAVAAGELAEGGSVAADPYVSPDGTKYDGVECSADVPYFDPDTDRYLYTEVVFPWDIYYYDPVTDAFEYMDGDGNLQPAPHITHDDVIAMTDTGFFRTAENDPGQSWINAVVQTFNREFRIDSDGIPCADPNDDSRCWSVVPEVVAHDDVFAADLVDGGADPTNQLGQLEALLTSARHSGSWNWLGLSAGLMDAGIPQAIKAQYPTDTDGSYLYEPLDGTGYVPWRPAGGDPCPSFPDVTTGTQADIEAGLANVIDQAMTWSPGLKAIVVRYPWLTERTSTDTGDPNPCAADGDADGVPDNREAIMAVNSAVDAALATVPVPDDVFELDLAAELDLNEGFTDEPTDSVPGRLSYLQLTRPYGYPYPSDAGSSSMGSQAYDSIEASGLQPPTIEGVVVEAADDDPATPSTSADHLRNAAGWYRAPGLYVEWQADAPEGIFQLSRRTPLLRGSNRSYTGTVVDDAGQTATAPATVSWDPDPPSVTPVLGGGTSSTTGGVTWWRSRPTVSWTVADDANLGLYTDANTPSGPATVPATVSSIPDGKDVLVVSGTATDVAGNTATGEVRLNVDTVAPTLTHTMSTGSGWSNATSSTVTWNRSDATSGVAVAGSTTGVVGTVTSSTSPPVTAEGRTPVEHTVLDVAGNRTTKTVDVLLDRTKPDITIPGVPAPHPTTGELATLDVENVASRLAHIASLGCKVTNTNPGVNEVSPIEYESEPVMTREVGDGGVTYTFTCTARDEAGNERVVTGGFFVEVTDPPQLEAAFVPQANSAGWWNVDVGIDWTATPADGWGLHPYLGDHYGGSWDIDADGVGTFRSLHDAEGVYDVDVPVACHEPQPGALCADPVRMRVKLDKTPPQVAPQFSGPIGGGGWYLGPVSVTWVADDVIPVGSGLTDAEISGVPGSEQPPSIDVDDEGEHVITTNEVTDRAGNSTTGTATVLIDATDPTITGFTGVVDDGVYTLFDEPVVDDIDCQAVDLPPPGAPEDTRVSEVDGRGCTAAFVGSTPIVDPLPPVDGEQLSAPMHEVVWSLSASDVATNTTHEEVTTRVLQFVPGRNGRMTVGGHLDAAGYGRVRTSGTLRCNGSPNNLGVTWSGSSFTLEWIDHFYCWDQGNLEGNPGAPIDSLYGLGRGRLADGRAAVIEWTFKDREVPNRGQDTMRIVITVPGEDGDHETVLDVGGLLTGGNFQAHEAQGNGTNDNGNVNGPTGSTSNRSLTAVEVRSVAAVLPAKPRVR